MQLPIFFHTFSLPSAMPLQATDHWSIVNRQITVEHRRSHSVSPSLLPGHAPSHQQPLQLPTVIADSDHHRQQHLRLTDRSPNRAGLHCVDATLLQNCHITPPPSPLESIKKQDLPLFFTNLIGFRQIATKNLIKICIILSYKTNKMTILFTCLFQTQ